MRVIASGITFLVGLAMPLAVAAGEPRRPGQENDCQRQQRPVIDFVELQSTLSTPAAPPAAPTQTPLTVKGKLMLPVALEQRTKCFVARNKLPAVVILHGSAGVDARGDFYARALNEAGIATLEIDMWEARGMGRSLAARPPHPSYTYRDAFAALEFLSSYPGIDPARIGVLGFSWGGVMTLAAASSNIAAAFTAGPDAPRFKAHLAHYPVCYAYNNASIPGSSFGSQAGNPLTGAPILIQTGSADDYDEGVAPCLALHASLDADEKKLMQVVVYEAAGHAWDRLQVPVTAVDPFAHRGRGGAVRIVPDVNQAYRSRELAVDFFRRNL
ncbi:MAG: prolyl oligopeptidase family serine peptidase [Candidatus Accumulibacter sp. UW20]|jgi:dienelactone hydrolase